MRFKTQIQEGIFLKRYKRFFADVRLDGEIVVAHVPNTGSMKGTTELGAPCLVTPSDIPERKLKYTLEAVRAASGSWVGVNTSWPNHLAREAFESRQFKHWTKFDQFQAEVKLSPETRIDIVLTDSQSLLKHFIEIKNVSMAGGDLSSGKGTAFFPDAVTTRGQKHLRELMKLTKQGHSAEILFAVQRSDCSQFSPADEIDPEYGKLLRQAAAVGVLITVALVKLSPREILFTGETLDLKL